MFRPAVGSWLAARGGARCVPCLAMDAISNLGARAVFSRGNPGVVDCTTSLIHGGNALTLRRDISRRMHGLNAKHVFL